ncbi:MAG: hypothetical protein QMC93_02095 [Patescibacteria group bacterium]|nr:hypothetical protein [Patescibacteria group bacterium]
MPNKSSTKENQPKEIPTKILDLMESEETALTISEVCLLNGVEEGVEGGEGIEKVAYQVARVLLGDLPPEILEKSLEKNEGFSQEIARNIAQEIDQRIFSKVRESLAILYEKEVPPEEKAPLEKPEISEKPSKKDIYRERIE